MLDKSLDTVNSWMTIGSLFHASDAATEKAVLLIFDSWRTREPTIRVSADSIRCNLIQ